MPHFTQNLLYNYGRSNNMCFTIKMAEVQRDLFLLQSCNLQKFILLLTNNQVFIKRHTIPSLPKKAIYKEDTWLQIVLPYMLKYFCLPYFFLLYWLGLTIEKEPGIPSFLRLRLILIDWFKSTERTGEKVRGRRRRQEREEGREREREWERESEKALPSTGHWFFP